MNTQKKMAKFLKVGQRIALPGKATDRYDIEVHDIIDVWHYSDGWIYLRTSETKIVGSHIRLDAEQYVTVVLPQFNSAGTHMVRIEGVHLLELVNNLRRKDVYLVRVDQRGDSVAFKFNEGTWTAGLGTPQPPY